MRKELKTENAPAAIGPFSQAIRAGDFVYVSGQLPIDPKTNQVVTDIKSATEQIFKNITSILESENLSLQNVIKVNVYLRDMNDFVAMNDVYKTFFDQPYPARTTIQAARLPKDVIVEAEAVAYVR